jgi:uridine kinase
MTDANLATAIAEECFQRIRHLKTPAFIAVTGDSGSGKSYYSRLIRNLFEEANIPYSYIDHDSFLISRKAREPLKQMIYSEGEFKGKTHWEILENWFRMDEYDRVINELRTGKTTSYFPYKRELGDLDSNAITVEPKDFILFDTTMQTEKMDFIIQIEVSPENIMKRKLERDKDLRTPEQIIDMQKRVQGYCWERTKPDNADIIIDNNDFNQPFFIKR